MGRSHFRLSPGWHVYWKNSGDAGFPPTATFQPAAVLGTPEILWPTPRRFDLPGDLVAFGYEGEVVYPVRAEIKAAAPAAATAGTTSDVTAPQAPQEILHITADLDYLVCQVDCVPFRYTLALDQPLGDKPVADPATATILQSWVERLRFGITGLVPYRCHKCDWRGWREDLGRPADSLREVHKQLTDDELEDLDPEGGPRRRVSRR